MQRPPIAVRPAVAADGRAVAEILARAFAVDPALSYVFPDDARRPRQLAQFFDLMRRAEADPADTLIDGGDAAVTVWRKPGEWHTPVSTMVRLAWPMVATFGTGLPRELRLQALLDRHHPTVPHWYLQFAGCDPARQGRGFGGTAMRARLAQTDAAGRPTALETANPANLALYGALGYKVTGTFDVTSALRFWTMWREARP